MEITFFSFTVKKFSEEIKKEEDIKESDETKVRRRGKEGQKFAT